MEKREGGEPFFPQTLERESLRIMRILGPKTLIYSLGAITIMPSDLLVFTQTLIHDSCLPANT